MSGRKDLQSELAALAKTTGPRYWRSLEELADTEAFQELMQHEFPEQASVWPDSLSRRQFLTLMGASLALAGLSGCSVRPAPSVNLVPYVHPPEEVVPGRPLFYATRHDPGRRRRRRAGRKPHGPADQDRGQPRSSGQPRGHQHLRPGIGASALRPRPLADGHAPRADALLGRCAPPHSAPR